jgi:hypothetical protein
VFKNAIVDFLLRHLPSEQWNNLSSLFTSISWSTIGSPILFTHNNLACVEFPADSIPKPFDVQFLDFCYPVTLHDRETQIHYDRSCYWKNASTLLVLDETNTILGCVQIVFRTDSDFLPVEYAIISINDKETRPLSIDNILNDKKGVITEIYRCRRSFSLTKSQTLDVLLMLFKGIWIKIQQSDCTFSLISFDPSQPELKNLYIRKFDFTDPHIALTYGSQLKKWSLLIKDWEEHRKYFASKGKIQFYLQTWGDMNVKKHSTSQEPCHTQATAVEKDGVLFTQTIKTKTAKAGSKNRRHHTAKKRFIKKKVRNRQGNDQTA